MTQVTFKSLNTSEKLGAKFLISGSDSVYIYDECQLPKNGQFRATNEKLGAKSKIGLNAKLFLVG